MDCYIIRIYRRDEQQESTMTGLVETVGESGLAVFKTPDELWQILRKRTVPRGGKARGKEPQDKSVPATDR
jgi:hypothetical protein